MRSTYPTIANHITLSGYGDPAPDCVNQRGDLGYYYIPMLRLATGKTYTTEAQQPLNWIVQNALYRFVANDTTLQNSDSTGTLAAFVSIAAARSRYSWLAQIADALAAGDTTNARSLLGTNIDTYLNTDSDAITGVLMQDDISADYIVQHYLDYYNLYLAYSAQAMTGSDSSSLAILAALCPFVDGNVVYEARALYRYVFKDDKTVFIDDCSLEGSGARGAGKAVIEAQQYQLFPNPNDGSFTLQQLITDDQPVLVEIRDVFGKLVFRNQVTFTNGRTLIALGNIGAGIYMVKIADGKGGVNNFKLIVQ